MLLFLEEGKSGAIGGAEEMQGRCAGDGLAMDPWVIYGRPKRHDWG
jgi:hypothetical protein